MYAAQVDGEAADTAKPLIRSAYTMFVRIPVFVDARGVVHTDTLWAIDLEAHHSYLADLRLCCPVVHGEAPPAGWMPVSGLDAGKIVAMREDKGWGSVIANLLPNFLAVRKAARATRIAHGGLAGWAFPPDYYLLLLRPFLRFTWIVNMESSFWMRAAGTRASLRQRIGHHVHLFLGRACMRAADIRLFTQDWYRQLMLGDDRRNSFINEAVWVSERDALPAAEHEARAGAMSGQVRLLFPTRLIVEKGIDTVFDAIVRLEESCAGRTDFPGLQLDIVGSGPLEARVRAFVAKHAGKAVRVTMLEPVAYGQPFFGMLRGYDAIIVANLSEEQPRVIYDAFSQGVPCIASSTTGIRQIVREGETALLFSPGSGAELAALLASVACDRAMLRRMGDAAIRTAHAHTHEAMHRDRARFLIEEMGLS